MVTTYFVPVEDKSLGAPRLVDPKTQSTITDRQANHVHRLFRTQVLGPSFACALGKNALANWRYRVGVYKNFDAEVGSSVCEDLWSFVADQRALSANPDDFSTFITIFVTLDIPRDENEFESRLWTILQEIHDKDAHVYRWDPQTTSDPDLPDFSFSVASSLFSWLGSMPIVPDSVAGSHTQHWRLMLTINLSDSAQRENFKSFRTLSESRISRFKARSIQV